MLCDFLAKSHGKYCVRLRGCAAGHRLGLLSVGATEKQVGVNLRLALCIFLASSIGVNANAQVVIDDAPTATEQPRPATPPKIFNFEIPAQPLITALDAYNLQTGSLLFYDSRLVQGIRSSAVTGDMSAQDALAALLAGTNLSPVRTNNGVITLMMNAQSIRYSPAPAFAAPLLTLDAISVDPPRGGDHRFYAASLAYAIQGALQHNAYLRRKNYRLDLNVWVTRSGEIENFQFIEPVDNQMMDRTIASVLHQLTVEQAPADLDQPVHVKIHASGAS